MEHYERVMPGSANRILAMAESQTGHRQQLETTVVTGNIESERRGQRYGLAVVAAGRLDMNQKKVREAIKVVDLAAGLKHVYETMGQ